MHSRAHKGIWIPKSIKNLGLGRTEELLLSTIFHLDKSETHCFASNTYLANIIRASASLVSRYISKFKKMGLIEQVSFTGRIRTLKTLKENWSLKHEERTFSKKESYAILRNQTTQNCVVSPGKNSVYPYIYKKEYEITTTTQEIKPMKVVGKSSSSFSRKKIEGLESLELKPHQKEQIYKSFDEERILKGLEWFKSSKGIKDVGASLYTAIQRGYEAKQLKTSFIEKNKTYAKEKFHKYEDTNILGINVSICNTFIQFGQKIYYYSDNNFFEEIKKVEENLKNAIKTAEYLRKPMRN